MNVLKSLILSLLTITTTFSQVKKIEPPFWWSGMNYSEVEILLYGDNLSQYEVKSELPIITITRVENPNYLFVKVDTKGKKAGNYQLSLVKNQKKIYSYDYQLLERKEGSAERKGFDASDVIYLLMPDRFANGNPQNDSHPNLQEKANQKLAGGRHGGDIQGIINHLDYLQELGATALWSTPLCEDNDITYSYHTYAQSDVYQIDARYGTNEDYKNLAKELHKRGMKLLMDYVTNHWGVEHWMIKDLPMKNWIHQFPEFIQSNYRMETQMDPNASEIDKTYCTEGWFVPSMADLNQSNPMVLNYLVQNAIWWIEYADLDGFRVDTYSYNQKEAIADWTKAIMEEYPNFNIVGEVWMHDQAQISYWQKDSPIGAIQSYNSYLPAVMDFTLHDAIGGAFQEKPAWDKGMITIYNNFVNDFLYKDVNNLLIFAENHDTQRINHIYKNPKDYQLIITLLATVRGIPQIYYGSEIGMAGDKEKGDADIRQDFPGGWAYHKHNAFTEKGRSLLQKQYFDYTAKILNWRKNKSVIHFGKTRQYIPENEVYVFFRYNEKESVMVILNSNEEEQNLNIQRFAEDIQNKTKGKDIISGKLIDLTKNISIKGKTAMVIEIE